MTRKGKVCLRKHHLTSRSKACIPSPARCIQYSTHGIKSETSEAHQDDPDTFSLCSRVVCRSSGHSQSCKESGSTLTASCTIPHWSKPSGLSLQENPWKLASDLLSTGRLTRTQGEPCKRFHCTNLRKSPGRPEEVRRSKWVAHSV